jgi:hypothetical protein
MSPLQWLKAVPTPLAGTAYEPWVQLLQFLLMVAVFISAISWLLTRRHVIAVGQRVWALVIQANNARKYASRYAPATERYLRRQAPYVALTIFEFLAIGNTLCMVLAIIVLLIATYGGLWWWAVIVTLFWVCFMVRLRLNWAAVSWAWHSITTGEEFIWPQRRTSQTSP